MKPDASDSRYPSRQACRVDEVKFLMTEIWDDRNIQEEDATLQFIFLSSHFSVKILRLVQI